MEITTAGIEMPKPTQVGVQEEELKPETVSEITMEITTAGIEMPKPTQVGVQEEELKPETVSEEIVIQKDEGVQPNGNHNS